MEGIRRQRYNHGRFWTLLSCLDEWAVDASTVVSGNAIVFEDFHPTVDAIYECLFAPSEYDNIVEEILTVLFGAFSSLLTNIYLMGNMMLQMYL